jgi:hypothetical protein
MQKLKSKTKELMNMGKRVCFNCQSEIPPETEHFIIDDEAYCTNCVTSTPFTAYIYELNGEFAGTSEDDGVRHIEAYEDDYEEGESS